MNIYQRSSKDKTLGSFNIRDTHTWDEVIRRAKDADRKYHDDAKGFRGIGRKIGRNMGDIAPGVNPWLGLLPNGEYTSILCGGLKLIFGAAARNSERRQQILDAFGSIPKTVQTVESCREKFPSDAVLKEISTELYLAILRAIEGMMQWLVDKAVWNRIKGVLLGPLYDKSLDEKIKDVEEQRRYLQDRVDSLRDDAIIRVDAATERLEPKVDKINLTIKDLATNTSMTCTSVKHIQSGMNSMSLTAESTNLQMSNLVDGIITLETLQGKQAALMEDHSNKMQSGIDSQNGIFRFLQEQLRMAEWREKRRETELQQARSKIRILERERAVNPSVPFLTQADLFILIAADPAVPRIDILNTIKQSQVIDPSSQGQAHWLMQHPKFQTWLVSDKAQAILVNGNASTYASERITSMSLLCALLVQSLAEVRPAICIHFFCGLHTTYDDALGGTSGLIRSLIAQLLTLRDFDLSFINARRYRDHLRNHDLEHLCELFRQLANQLPIDTVLFCVIDGISLFETPERWQETCFLMSKLREITEDDNFNPVFKLLITSPLRSRYVKEGISPEDHLNLPHDSGDDSQELTERQVVMRMRRPLRSVENSFHEQSMCDRYDVEDEGYAEVDFDEGNLSDELPDKAG
ncbi:MAG: hypothetical protein Q9187_004777 [Circinaria calcarea]